MVIFDKYSNWHPLRSVMEWSHIQMENFDSGEPILLISFAGNIKAPVRFQEAKVLYAIPQVNPKCTKILPKGTAKQD